MGQIWTDSHTQQQLDLIHAPFTDCWGLMRWSMTYSCPSPEGAVIHSGLQGYVQGLGKSTKTLEAPWSKYHLTVTLWTSQRNTKSPCRDIWLYFAVFVSVYRCTFEFPFSVTHLCSVKLNTRDLPPCCEVITSLPVTHYLDNRCLCVSWC